MKPKTIKHPKGCKQLQEGCKEKDSSNFPEEFVCGIDEFEGKVSLCKNCEATLKQTELIEKAVGEKIDEEIKSFIVKNKGYEGDPTALCYDFSRLIIKRLSEVFEGR